MWAQCGPATAQSTSRAWWSTPSPGPASSSTGLSLILSYLILFDLARSHTRGSGGRVKVAGARQVVDRYRDGAYRVLVWAVLEDAALQLENLFECEMFLPQTDFRLSKSTIYSPSK